MSENFSAEAAQVAEPEPPPEALVSRHLYEAWLLSLYMDKTQAPQSEEENQLDGDFS